MSKVALIIGASSGIGEAIALKLLKDGYTVYNGSRSPAHHERIINITVDVANEEAIRRALRIVWEAEHRIDALIYSAGFSMSAPLEDVDLSDVYYLFQVNLFGLLTFMKYLIPLCKIQGGGRIIAIGSLASVLPIPYDAYYSAAKAALNLLLLTQAIELKRFKILITGVLPGGVKTHFTFKRKEYWIDTFKYPDFNEAGYVLGDMEQKGMSPQRVAKKIVKLLNRTKPPLLLPIGFKNRLFYCAAKIFPASPLVYLVRRKFRLK